MTRILAIRACAVAAWLATFAVPAAATAQQPGAMIPLPTEVRRLTIDEAVQEALENNLGLQAARIGPAIQDLVVAQALAAWFPTLTTSVQAAASDSPNNSFLSGAQGEKTSDDRVAANVAVGQGLPWGGSYSIGWDSLRATTTNIFSNFSPQLRSSVSLSYRQPLLRGFSIDPARYQLLTSRTQRDSADDSVRQTVAQTVRAVRHAYWDLVYAIDSLAIQQQSLELAEESLRNTRARIEIGTTPPIDVVEAEAEVAQREEAVVVADAQIATAEDALRALVYDPATPGFWTVRIEPTTTPAFQIVPVDVDAAMEAALAQRTDLQQVQRTLETAEIGIRYLRNQTMPDVSVSVDYGVTGLGGTQFLRGTGFPGPIVGQANRGYSAVLGDLFRNEFPSWTGALTISYPLGDTPQHADLARARTQYSQSQTQLRDQQLQVMREVRDAARQVLTNQRRIETTGTSRQLAERRLEAEERKLAAGTSTSFFVFQAQRDLAQARSNELRAILDYNRSIVDFATVQQAPLR